MIAIIVALVMAVAAAAMFVVAAADDAPLQLTIATGPETGTYHTLGVAMAKVLKDEGLVASTEILTTEGSVANMDLVGGRDRGADLAFVQSDTKPRSAVRLLAPLYQEVLHILVARDLSASVTTVTDLEGLRVAMGATGSGTRSVAERVIDHFGVPIGDDIDLPPDEVASGLADGSIDAAFILSAIPSPVVEQLCELDAVRFLSLGDAQERGNEAEALALVFPSLASGVIPRATYARLPAKPVATIEVSAMLVASSELDSDFVTSVLSTLFAHRTKLIDLETERVVAARRIRERFQPEAVLIPYHGGAVDYYQRTQPPFIVEYAETMSFLLTVLVGIFSASVAVRGWMRRRMKNRIDVFYVNVNELTNDLQNMSLEELVSRRRELRELRQRAFSELVAERLEANESFTIFQDYLASERASIDAVIAERTGESRASEGED
ncbi:MAG: TAXI family TRAP transporter solute-binding subunit [Thermoanaerobaculales bacterium]|nr:TAXI family TRAP transporter solute-binding subunit [Thermoanaerobaculales bacterium]